MSGYFVRLFYFTVYFAIRISLYRVYKHENNIWICTPSVFTFTNLNQDKLIYCYHTRSAYMFIMRLRKMNFHYFKTGIYVYIYSSCMDIQIFIIQCVPQLKGQKILNEIPSLNQYTSYLSINWSNSFVQYICIKFFEGENFI